MWYSWFIMIQPISVLPHLLNWIIFWIEFFWNFFNWIFFWIEFSWKILNWIIFWIEFLWNNIELNIELNHFLAKFKYWIESIWVSFTPTRPLLGSPRRDSVATLYATLSLQRKSKFGAFFLNFTIQWRWCFCNQNSTKWPKMVQNDPKWPKMTQNVPLAPEILLAPKLRWTCHLRGSHGLSARRAWKTKSSRPEGPKEWPKATS